MRQISLSIAVLLVWSCVQIPVAAIPLPPSPRGAVVVTDIDGTLTPRNIEVNTVRPGAVEALNAIAAKGYTIVYLTARTPLLQAGLPEWLSENGFPPGPLHVAQTAGDRRHPEQFKAQVLADYRQAGWMLAYAYGDSSSDFIAYASANIPREHVFALKRKGTEDCQAGAYQSCLGGWLEYMVYIERDMPSVQK